jgi:hypothetical protein
MKIILEAKREPSIIRVRLLKRRRREVKEGSKAWWPMEGSKAWWPLEGEGRNTFSPLPFSPQQPLPKPSIFPFDLTVLLYHGLKSLLMPSFPFF